MGSEIQLAARSLCDALGLNSEAIVRVVVHIEVQRPGSQDAARFTPQWRAAIADELHIDEQYLYQLLTGRREMEPKAAVRLERDSGGRLRRWDLRSKSWHEVWPELIGTEGAPPIPTSVGEVRDAA